MTLVATINRAPFHFHSDFYRDHRRAAEKSVRSERARPAPFRFIIPVRATKPSRGGRASAKIRPAAQKFDPARKSVAPLINLVSSTMPRHSAAPCLARHPSLPAFYIFGKMRARPFSALIITRPIYLNPSSMYCVSCNIQRAPTSGWSWIKPFIKSHLVRGTEDRNLRKNRGMRYSSSLASWSGKCASRLSFQAFIRVGLLQWPI